MRNVIYQLSAMMLTTVALLNPAWARNPWVSAIGEASVAQHRAEDIANRIKRTAPHSYLVSHAMAFDHLACTLVQRVKCGAPCNQVQNLYQQLEGNWSQLRVAIYTDPCLCSDRTLKSLADGMDSRMRNLCLAIERVIEREFRCTPTISYRVNPYPSPIPTTPSFPNYSFQQHSFQQHSFQHNNFPTPTPYGPGWNQPSWSNPAFGPSGNWRAF